MQEKEFLPVYSALEKCLVLESHHPARSEVVKSIKSLLLFNDVIIAESFDDGIKKISAFEIDVCVVGSSVSPETADDFFERAEQETKSKDCAFVVLVDKEQEGISSPYVFKKSKPHGSISFPCTKRFFTEGIIKSIGVANVNNKTSSPLPGSKNFKTDQGAAASILGGDFGILDEIIEGVNIGVYSLDDDGKPSARAAEALDKVFPQLFKVEANSKKLLDFMDYFRRSLDQWFIDLHTLHLVDANQNFRAKLFSFIQPKTEKNEKKVNKENLN